ncbi:hypothetical protein E5163_02560 [Marinicauda algicola]|uniref:Serine aminopeptidase S33 domain-containing protein n=1 Tax=Marinicauda algicola TaxID=2029849 RepID=A0A4S2H422_9PROT|nr:alpha/beta hydrolase [Marinicauda algicola]TGY90032.1 hypothetical protein E5163_02560 [Marinicauda algicola]
MARLSCIASLALPGLAALALQAAAPPAPASPAGDGAAPAPAAPLAAPCPGDPSPGPGTAPPAAGASWAGWVDLGEAGDFPFRVRLREDGSGSLDIPAAQLFGAPLAGVRIGEDRLAFDWPSRSGAARRFSGQRENGFVSGEIDFAGTAGTFVLSRAASEIAEEDSAALEPGWYRFENAPGPADDTVWHVERRGFGETVIRVVNDGRQRTAFPAGNSRFFTGSRLYVPGPASARFAARRGTIEMVQDGLGAQGSGHAFEIVETSVVIETARGPVRVLMTERDDAPLGIGLVYVQGSDWRLAEDDAFRRHGLAALGLTVISWDKRGHGATPGPAVRAFADTARDAASVGDWVRSARPDLTRVGILGVSRGGWIAPLVPGLPDRFDFAVLAVTPAVSPFVQEFEARLRTLGAEGADEETLAFAGTYFDALIDFARDPSPATRERYENLHAAAAGRLPQDMLGASAADEQAWRWWRLNGDHDPAPALSALPVPTLALFGSRDLVVDTARAVALMERFDLADGRRDIVFRILEGAGHDLALARTGPLWAFDCQGSEGVADVWRFALDA